MKRHIILTTAAAVLTVALPFTTLGTIPVIDYTQAANMIQQGLRQVQQLSTEINTLQNTVNTYKLAVAQATGLAQIAKLYQQYQQVQSQLQGLSAQFTNGSQLQSYLSNFQNVNQWAAVSPSALPAQAAASQAQASTYQQQADQAWVQNLSKQQQLLSQDASNLQQAQSNAQGATSALAEMQANSQILAAMAAELQQIHALLVAQQTALANQVQGSASDAAARAAANQAFEQWTVQPGSGRTWAP